MPSVDKVQVNVIGRVRNTRLPKTKPLLPLFEAIVNSIQAIEATDRTNGDIEIVIVRDNHQLTADLKDGTHAPIIGFMIIDNGKGFDVRNYESFLTSDSRLKERQGGKGVGRFLWLKAFGHVAIESVYHDNSIWCRRSFVFAPTENGIETHTNSPLEKSNNHAERTVVTLSHFHKDYQPYTPKKMDTIALRIIEHCLSYFLLNRQCPKITVREENRHDGELCLNKMFEDIRSTAEEDDFTVQDESFRAVHVRLYAAEETHKIHFCARDREVRNEQLVLPNLTKRLKDNHGQFAWSTFIFGRYLDEHVNAERYDFMIDEEDDALDFGNITFQKIRAAILPLIQRHLERYVAPIREEKLAQIRRYTENESPKYRVLLRRYVEELDTIPVGLTEDKLEAELHKVYHAAERDIKDQATRLLHADIKTLSDLTAYRSEYNKFIEDANELGKSNLAEYVIYRRLILDLLRTNLKTGADGKYKLEEDVHGIIFPLRATSDEVPEEHQNLWIIDERLTYHAFLASDKKLSELEAVDVDGDKRPDIVLGFSYSHAVDAEGPYSSIVIVEFKRPGREGYGDSPIQQVYDYIDRIRAGKIRRPGGRMIPLNEGVAFFAYVICDITDKVRRFASDADFTRTPDGEGYFAFHKGRGAYVEIMSYNKMLRDAEARNRVLFKKLGLPSRSSM